MNALGKGQAIFVSDFKENMSLKVGSVELGNDFFNRPQRSVFCTCVYHKLDDDIHLDIYSFISENLDHDPNFIKGAWDKILTSDEFKKLDINDINFWMDNCKGQFRNNQLMTHFTNLRHKYKEIGINFFTEYHGKNRCDTHFSRISTIYSNRTMKENTMINTTDELIHLLKEGFSDAQGVRELFRKNVEYPGIVSFVNYNPPPQTSKVEQKFDQFTRLYSFTIKDNTLIGRLNLSSTKTKTWRLGKEKEIAVNKTPKIGFRSKPLEVLPATMRNVINVQKRRAGIYDKGLHDTGDQSFDVEREAQ